MDWKRSQTLEPSARKIDLRNVLFMVSVALSSCNKALYIHSSVFCSQVYSGFVFFICSDTLTIQFLKGWIYIYFHLVWHSKKREECGIQEQKLCCSLPQNQPANIQCDNVFTERPPAQWVVISHWWIREVPPSLLPASGTLSFIP